MKPMKSADLAKLDNDVTQLRYPLLASPKLDGLRCLLRDGVALSNNLEPFRNRYVQEWARVHDNLDGELIVGSPNEGNVLGRTQSGIMSFDGEPDFTFHAFDRWRDVDLEYRQRWHELTTVHAKKRWPRVVPLGQIYISTAEQLIEYEQKCIADGYEGIMIRDPLSPYKYGRSTLREGYLIKLKRFMDGEATVVALEEAEHNTNDATRDATGRLKRSAAQAGKVGNGMIGTIIVNDSTWGELRLAPGTMSHAERRALWLAPRSLIGRVVHWRSFGYGIKDKPRFPRYYGVREDV